MRWQQEFLLLCAVMLRTFILVAVLGVISASPLDSDGFRNPFQSRGDRPGNAFAAQADEASALTKSTDASGGQGEVMAESTEQPRVGLTLALVVISWFGWVAFQTTQLVRERSNLEQAKANQEIPFQQSVKARAQIDSITADTAKLATQGNANAQLVLAELQKRGIKIDPNAKTVPPGSK